MGWLFQAAIILFIPTLHTMDKTVETQNFVAGKSMLIIPLLSISVITLFTG